MNYQRTLRALCNRHQLKKLISLLAFLIYAFLPTVVEAYTVKRLCSNETKPAPSEMKIIEMICEGANDIDRSPLETMDLVLNGYYRAAKERAKDKEKLLRDQTAWLKERNACPNTECMRQAYHRRIMELAAVPAKAAIHDIKYESFDGVPGFILTRENGLKHFDGGASDYDVVAGQAGRYDRDGDCYYDSYYLIGTRKTIKTRCMKDGHGVFQSAITTDGKEFQLLIAYKPESRNYREKVTAIPWNDRLLITPTTELIWGVDSNGLAVAPEVFSHTKLGSGLDTKALWHWAVVAKSLKQGSKTFVSSPGRDWIPLADGSVLEVLMDRVYRFDPKTGHPYDNENIKVFPVSQAIAWRLSWIKEYVAKTPSCQGDIRRCPDKKAASQYLFQRFDEEMNRQFASPAK